VPWSIAKRGSKYCVVKDGSGEVEGCHASRSEAMDQLQALYAAEDDAGLMAELPEEESELGEILAELRNIMNTLNSPVKDEEDEEDEDDYSSTEITTDIEVPTAERFAWEGPITYEGTETGDGRIFKEGAVVWNEDLLPFPFNWQRTSSVGHDASITIGRVDSIFRGEDGAIWARGIILSGPDAPPEAEEYVNLLRSGAAGGVSIDGDSAQFEIEGSGLDDMKMIFSSINIRALTAVSIPAFAGAKITLCDSVVAAVIGSTDLPVASREQHWDGLAAQRGIFEWAKTEDGFDAGKLARAFLWRDSDGDPQEKGSYKLPFTQVVDGSLVIVPKAVFAAAAAVEGARGGVKIPDSDKAGVRRKLTTLYGKIPPVEGEDGHPTPPWESDKGDAAILDLPEFIRIPRTDREWDNDVAIVASSVPVCPPSDWFANPQFSELTPITITDEGQVFGHLCGKDTCHIGYGSCKTAPRNCDYDEYFHLGQLKTAEGDVVHVGHMTFGGGHAPLENSANTAAAYYDSTSRVSADIRCGEDQFGTWVVGALRPGLSDEDIREIRSAPLSGDWRPISGKLQLIAAHAVNVPGFPVPRAKVLVASGQTETIILTEDCGCVEEEFSSIMFQIDVEEMEN
jgi:hypothetical protein